MRTKTASRLLFAVVGLVWLGIAPTQLRAFDPPPQCDWFNCEQGGGFCCLIDLSTYDCNDYCDRCYTIGHEEGYCEIGGYPGVECACNPM